MPTLIYDKISKLEEFMEYKNDNKFYFEIEKRKTRPHYQNGAGFGNVTPFPQAG